VKTVAKLIHLDDGEFPALRAQIEARPPRVGARTQRPPLPLGAPARAVAALAEMRAADVPDAPVALRYPAPVRVRQLPLLVASAATVHRLAVAYDDVATELETALAELAELAPFTAKARVATPETTTPSRLPDCDCGAPRFGAGMPTCTDCDEAAYNEWWNAQASQPSDAESGAGR